MSEKYKNIIGPRSEDRGEREPDEFHSKSGEPLWMALLTDEQTLAPKHHEVEDAKNRLAVLMNEHKEEIDMCREKSTEECRSFLKRFDLSEAV
jgi:hypothetical protein